MTIPAQPKLATQEFLSLLTPESSILRAAPRLAMSLEALDKSGKTHYALMTAPDPIALISTDPGTQTVVDKARAAGKVIHQLRLDWDPPEKLSKSAKDIDKDEWQEWIDCHNKHNAFINALIKDRSCRTLVKDTETDLWHLAELAYFGKAAGNSSMDIRPRLNHDYTGTFRRLYKSRPDLNIILIHKLKKKYIKGKGPDAPADWNGEYETDGYSRIAFEVDLTLRAEWDKNYKDFCTYFDSNKAFRQWSLENAPLLNKRWYSNNTPDDPSTFWNLGLSIYPDTADTPELWGM